MTRRMIAAILTVCLLMSLSAGAVAVEEPKAKLQGTIYENAIYLGVENYGTVSSSNKDNFDHRFSVNGTEVKYKVSNANNYALQNVLAEGYVFDIDVDTINNEVIDISIPQPEAAGTVDAITGTDITVDGTVIPLSTTVESYDIATEAGGAVVTAQLAVAGDRVKVYGNPVELVCITFVAEDYQAPVKGTSGLRTLKNFLQTSMEPVGTALYVYGGAWDWQDVGSSNQSTTIGLSQTWIDFFQSKDATYTYRDSTVPAQSYYPHEGYNQYYYAGIDCSGYVAWATYNIMNTTDGNAGYVVSSTMMAKSMANAGFGTWTQNTPVELRPGDVFSMSGHTWICLGVCSDGSAVILHSTPSVSRLGASTGSGSNPNAGGGVQISAIGNDDSCEAYALAKEYMQRYYPAWDARYEAVRRSYSSYTSLGTSANTGRFRWNLDTTGVLDPDGYANMSAKEVLQDLFGEKEERAIYLGVENYGTVSSSNKDNFDHRFSVNGTEVKYKVSNANNYALQNVLAEGYVFDIDVDTINNEVIDISIPQPEAAGTVDAITATDITVDGTVIPLSTTVESYDIATEAGGAVVTAQLAVAGDRVKVYGNPVELVCITFVAEDYQAPVKGTPGLRTLKNFLQTSMEPVGTALYVYGGAWDWQDVGSSNQSTTIGLSQTWIDFFQSKDATYTYRDSTVPAQSYYPHEGYNQYYYAGIDCSGYVAWATYNIMNTTDGNAGYVVSSTMMAKSMANAGFGTWTQNTPVELRPGDVFSMSGHTWICLGVCSDGSAVILHSTPSVSRLGASTGSGSNPNAGGGVQISAIGNDDSCEAYALAKEYMQRYYPAWDARYEAVRRSYSSYTSLSTSANTGRFRWNLDTTGVLDPDGYANMSAKEVLQDLFGENTGSSNGGGGTTTKTYQITVENSENGKVTASSKKAASAATVTLTITPNEGYELKTITVETADGKTIGTKALLNGKYSFIMPKQDVTVSASFQKKDTVPPTVPPVVDKELPFTDVQKSDWFYDAVVSVYENKWMQGISEKLFAPSETMTRGMAVQILYNMAGKPSVSAADMQLNFTDVSSGDWFVAPIAWAYNKGLISGYGEGVMGPHDSVTREQLVVMLYNYQKMLGADVSKKGDLSSYQDAGQVSQWANTALSWAVGENIISGRPGNVLAPTDDLNRSEMAQILWNFSQDA